MKNKLIQAIIDDAEKQEKRLMKLRQDSGLYFEKPKNNMEFEAMYFYQKELFTIKQNAIEAIADILKGE